MICAPRQTILLCVAALIVNAAASEIESKPANDLREHWAGQVPFVFENGCAECKSRPLSGIYSVFSEELKKSKGIRSAFAGLKQGNYDLFVKGMEQTAADESDPGRFTARLFLADRAFQSKHFFKAGSLYFSVLNDGAVPLQAGIQGATGALDVLLRTGADKEALATLKKALLKFPGQQLLWEKFEVFFLGRSGDYLELNKVWSAGREKHSHAPEPLIFEGLTQGADAAVSQMPGIAESFYADAFNFALNDTGRRNCLKKIIALQEKENPEKALLSVERYLRFFPQAADAGMVKLLKGELLVRVKKFSEALRNYREILNSRQYKFETRVQAAFRAAAVAEKNGDLSMAREFYNSAIRRFAAYPEFANRVKIQLLEFMIRSREFSSAAVLGDELAGVQGVDQERLNILRLKALTELKRYADAAAIALTLSFSANTSSAAEGAWQLARLNELQGKNKEAERLYISFAEKFTADKRVPDALLAAIDFAIKGKEFNSALTRLQQYLQKFPDHAGVRKSMNAVVFVLLQHDAPGDRKKAEEMFGKMQKLFPGVLETDRAALELIRHSGKHDEYVTALKWIETFLKERENSPLVPEVLLLGAENLERMGKFELAAGYVDRLLDKYPNSSFAVESAMLGGSCCFQAGDYRSALKYYERACELGGRGLMAQVAAGEAADCHLQLRKKENLAAAIRIYRDLANRSEFPALQIQALYKLAVAYEYDNNNMSALETYEELLTLAVNSEKVRRSSGAALWCARGARSALRIILGNSNLPDGSQRAQRLFRLYSMLDLPGSSGELRRYLEEIRKHYNLLD